MPGHLTVDIGGMPLPRQSVIPPDFDARCIMSIRGYIRRRTVAVAV
ncbi:hypothetical protein O0544_02170 [Edwardsiella anguillarum]|nr:hypothetical protein [Edwardsiella anguillarum]